MMVDRELTRLLKDRQDIELDKIDILSHPRQAWNEGVRMIPALKSGDRILSGIILGKKDIQQFLEESHLHNSSPG